MPTTLTQSEVQILADAKLYRRANALIALLVHEPLCNLKASGIDDRVQYKKKHQSRKRKGGSPPIDYFAVELKVDLESALRRNQTEEVRRAYYPLARLMAF